MGVQSNASDDHDHDEDTTGDWNDDNTDGHLPGHVIDGHRDDLDMTGNVIVNDDKEVVCIASSEVPHDRKLALSLEK